MAEPEPNEVFRCAIFAQPRGTEPTKSMKACLLTSDGRKDGMQVAFQDIRLAEWFSGSGLEQEAGLPLPNEFRQHMCKGGREINLPHSVYGFRGLHRT